MDRHRGGEYPSQAAGQSRLTFSEPVKVWICSTSGIDGREQTRIVSVHERKSDAEARKSGWISIHEGLGIIATGSDGRMVYLIQGSAPLPLNEDVDEAQKKIRNRALAKLSPIERASLGVTA